MVVFIQDSDHRPKYAEIFRVRGNENSTRLHVSIRRWNQPCFLGYNWFRFFFSHFSSSDLSILCVISLMPNSLILTS